MAQARSPRQRSASTQVREWIRDRTDTAERVTSAEMAEATVAWLQTNPELLDRFVYEQVFNTTAEIMRSVMTETRRIRLFTEAMAETEEVQRQHLQQWFDRMEHVSPEVGYARLGSLKRPDLRLAREERHRRLVRDTGTVRWFAVLERGLPDDDTTVEQRFTARQVEQAHDLAQATLSSRMDTILAGVDDVLKRILDPDDGQGQPAPQK